MTKKINWRLKEQPSTEALRQLVKDGILTKEEAREILFSYAEHEDTTNDSKATNEEALREEIKFLRRLVDKLSAGQTTTVIHEIDYWRPRWSFVAAPYKAYSHDLALFNSGDSQASLTNLASLN